MATQTDITKQRKSPDEFEKMCSGIRLFSDSFFNEILTCKKYYVVSKRTALLVAKRLKASIIKLQEKL